MKALLLPFAIIFAVLYNISKVINSKGITLSECVSLLKKKKTDQITISDYQFFYSFLNTSQNPFLIKPLAQMIPGYAKQNLEQIHIMPLSTFFGAN
jgi:hypothetical protein